MMVHCWGEAEADTEMNSTKTKDKLQLKPPTHLNSMYTQHIKYERLHFIIIL